MPCPRCAVLQTSYHGFNHTKVHCAMNVPPCCKSSQGVLSYECQPSQSAFSYISPTILSAISKCTDLRMSYHTVSHPKVYYPMHILLCSHPAQSALSYHSAVSHPKVHCPLNVPPCCKPFKKPCPPNDPQCC